MPFEFNVCRYSKEERRTVLGLTAEDVDDEVRGAIGVALGL